MAAQRKQFPFPEFETRWQTRWLEDGAFRAINPGETGFDPSKPKYYVLDMFPYPSGEGLHVGHVEGYTATDIVSRFKRMRGFNVLHPMGWDAFGLPAEQFAIKTGRHPRETTARNIARFKAQLQALGLSYDWSREVSTTDPEYFRWTQWIFLQLYNSWFNPATKKAEPVSTYPGSEPDKVRLAYVAEMPVNWCPALGTVLANEEVIDGKSEVGGHPVERRPLRQWMLRITAFAERLIGELDGLDWPEGIKLLQRNWIGRSEGAMVKFSIFNSRFPIEVFTTRPDTLFGATYLVLSPEHPMVPRITSAAQRAAVEDYQKQVGSKSDLERTELAKDKTGVFTGAFAVNPVSGELLPVWIADYVLMGYGTGAIMAVPGHDERDFEFATKYKLKIRQVVEHPQRGGDVPSPAHGIPAPSSSQRGGDVPSPFFAPREEIEVHRGKLPHWQQPGKLYFLTWRLADSIPSEKLDSWKEEIEQWKKAHPEPWTSEQEAEYHRLAGGRIEEWLDNGHGACVLKDEKIASVVIGALKHFDGQKYEIRAFVVMPNHVHVFVRVFEGEELPALIQGWKGWTAKEINKLLGKEGTLWQSEYFDRIVRSPEHAARIDGYIMENARKARIEGTGKVFVKEQEGDGTSPPPLRTQVFTGDGTAVNSQFLDGLTTVEAKKKIIAWLKDKGLGQATINYKLRDWLFSRQRYWGEPFPIVWEANENGKLKHRALDEKELPVVQPDMDDFKPTGTAEAPLSKAADWLKYSEKATREIYTMPQWAGSCWYYLRFCDPKNSERFIGKDAESFWMGTPQPSTPTSTGQALNPQPAKGGVDLYVGGTEHAVLHLLYARFWHKALFDLGCISTPEPFQRLVNQGIILGPDNQKMSKSRGNVVTPDTVIAEYGADSLRLYEMFMGPLEQMKPWSMKGVEGVYRFLGRVWRLAMEETQEGDWVVSPGLKDIELTPEQLRVAHATIKKVTADVDDFAFNTAISQMMVFTNEFVKTTPRPIAALRILLPLLSPFAPHLAEELWEHLGKKFPEFKGRASAQPWPVHDEKHLLVEDVELVVQVNGKLRDRVKAKRDAADPELEKLALASPKVQEAIVGKEVVKVIVIKGKLINIVVKQAAAD